MLSRSNPTSRIPLLRPLRPPSRSSNQVQPRLFTQHSPLLLLAPRVSRSRPQLPYLAQPSYKARHAPFLQGQIIRLLSTETRQYVREQLWLAGKWTVVLWTFVFLGAVAWSGYGIEVAERTNPTPEEWYWWSRQMLRSARKQHQAAEHTGFVDWAQVGSHYKALLERLEDPHCDGKGLADREDGGLLIPGVGKAGFDVSAKSWPWRACYFETLMGCATAAEHLSEMVLDKSRNMLFPREYMVGPSNPDPRPVPSYMHAAPLEENCTGNAFEAPETFYVRILTGAGFTTKQKLDAALAYGNWLEYKGLHQSATEAYQWAVDIAKTGVQGDASGVIGDRDYVLQADATTRVTANLARATTQFAVHKARAGDVAAALPILLSVLRAKRTAPISTHGEEDYSEDDDRSSQTDIGAAWSMMKKLFKPPPFPSPPPSGDLPLTRTSDRPTCEESEMMLYIGEILFTTSGDAKEGIHWTRQAVTIAEANLQGSASISDRKALARTLHKCKECLTIGVSNWETMLKRLSEDVDKAGASRKKMASWFGSNSREATGASIADELSQVEKLKDRIIREGIDEQLARQKGHGSFLG